MKRILSLLLILAALLSFAACGKTAPAATAAKTRSGSGRIVRFMAVGEGFAGGDSTGSRFPNCHGIVNSSARAASGTGRAKRRSGFMARIVDEKSGVVKSVLSRRPFAKRARTW